MLSYQHLYHAGNSADVLKHALLALLMQFLQRKEKPLRVFDTHAGSGLYDLESTEACKTAEYREGIGRLFSLADIPESLVPYLTLVRGLNPDGNLRRYPGSPLLVTKLLRPDDHLELMELHPRALNELRNALGHERRVHIHNRDGFEGLPALLPPRERRGLVLIDPSYEVKEEFHLVQTLLQEGMRRWATGCYAIWYPLLNHPAAVDFLPRLVATGIPRIFRAELALLPRTQPGMTGSGM
ncbi:MAG: 23S rRNA (adenine(2030)-N(6))-methyltransferase RlmJ, partial [Gammaproteobacteria bacterium]|nr:23S rRNA (adenine(2030)-N(6))-methyltransferase RlmJ [Gammaproteobacteria bacterium]MBU1656361.1 23S rRNA (adenine(2030)-N(6))-methyltransferase RlmJ [Gammaproteobacteria bacterium]MBU1959925.1 23S rRNA (adenine(2030)-N(6))-methyltransferase RlmJ [Gammaproteobacteria bacterium]